MILYYGIFVIIAFFSFVEMYGLERKDALKIFVLISLGLFTMSFIRWETGTDWSSYYDYFTRIPQELMPESNFEVGFTFLNGLVKVLTSEFTILLLFCAVIIYSFQSAAIWKLSPYPIFSLLFYWGIFFGGIFFVRQTIAVAILLYAVKYIKERRFWVFLFLVILAFLFHRTSFFFIVAYWIFHWRISWLIMIAGIFIAIAFASIASSIMQSFGAIAGGAIQVKIDAYTGDLQGDMMGLTQSMPVIIAKAFFSKLILLTAGLFLLKDIEKQHPEFRGYINLYWFGAVVFLMTITISPGLARLSTSFDLLQIIILPYIIRSIKDKNMRLLVIILSFVYIALRLYTVTTGGYYDLYVPYKTIFEQ